LTQTQTTNTQTAAVQFLLLSFAKIA
jgi:hypothetical protein